MLSGFTSRAFAPTEFESPRTTVEKFGPTAACRGISEALVATLREILFRADGRNRQIVDLIVTLHREADSVAGQMLQQGVVQHPALADIAAVGGQQHVALLESRLFARPAP